MPTTSSGRRPNRSPSLPYTGMTTVAATKYVVTMAGIWVRPPSSPAIAGSAGAMIVWSSAPSSITTISPGSARRIMDSPGAVGPAFDDGRIGTPGHM
jgi:hypothetical protein